MRAGKRRRKIFSLSQLAVLFYPINHRSASRFPCWNQPALPGVISYLALTIPASGAANYRVTLKTPVRKLRMIEREMQAAAFLSAERRIDDQRGDCRQVAQLEQVDGDFEVPIKLPDFALEVSQSRTGSLQAFVRPDDPRVIPRRPPDFAPVVIDHDQLVHVLNVARLPFRQRDLTRGMRGRLRAH